MTKDGRLENGMPVAIVQLFEPEGGQKVLRVTVPLGMQISHGTRLLIDQVSLPNPHTAFAFRLAAADYQVNDDMIGKMNEGAEHHRAGDQYAGHANQSPPAVKRFCQAL